MPLSLSHLFEFEDNFDASVAIKWAQNNGDLPIYAVTIYLAIVFQGRELLKDREAFKVRQAWSLWNLLLSVFSIIGATRTVPHLVSHIHQHGLTSTLCQHPEEWYLKGKCGLWLSLFIFSKVPELMDTVFLVLQKKKVIFLHWFHHVTVLLYCWHAFVSEIPPGLWFAAVNYSVHSVMYFYYFLSIMGGSYRKFARPIAPFITMFQLVQMVVGFSVLVAAAYKSNEGLVNCHANLVNYRLGISMYGSYFCLFAVLYYNLYLKPGGKHAKAKVPMTNPQSGYKSPDNEPAAAEIESKVCGVDLKKGDAAGFFHSNTPRNSMNKKEK